MDPNKPASAEFAAMVPVLAQTMKLATQALRQSVALVEALVSKGVLTRAEIDEKFRSTHDSAKGLLASLDDALRKMS
jgi:hypothetical protein